MKLFKPRLDNGGSNGSNSSNSLSASDDGGIHIGSNHHSASNGHAHQSNEAQVKKMQPDPPAEPEDNHLQIMGRSMTMINDLISNTRELSYATAMEDIENVCMIVVVDAEIRPIMEKYKFKRNEKLTKQFLNLGIVSSGEVGSLHLDVIKVAQSKVFQRHYSGYTQAAALAALVSSIIKPDIVISFGTAGGVTRKSRSEYGVGSNTSKSKTVMNGNNDTKSDDERKESAPTAPDQSDDVQNNRKKDVDANQMVKTVEVGDVVVGEACLFLDRLRTRNKTAFDWGLWGGSSMPLDTMIEECGLTKGVLASQIGYMVSPFQVEMIGNANIVALDMECAPIAQILNQTEIDFFALKVISNGIYPGNPGLMESEYHDNREMVSKKATEVLSTVIDYLDGKTKAMLSPKGVKTAPSSNTNHAKKDTLQAKTENPLSTLLDD